jgi:YHS domain-containing protein
MKRLALMTLLLTGGLLGFAQAADDEEDPAKEALQAVQEFVGSWKGSGQEGKNLWKETMAWGWKFKDGKSFLAFEVKDGKHLDKGELRYLADKKKYELTVTRKLSDGKTESQVYLGELKKGYLTLLRSDPKTKDEQQLIFNTAGDGVRLVYNYKIRKGGKGIASNVYSVAANKEGESLGAKKDGRECIVTGGEGTMAVSFGGKTYYVCCSGCRDEFNANPEKYVKAFEAKKKQ